jgi:hypothetical protein
MIVERLQKLGFAYEGAPTKIGGQWTYDAFVQSLVACDAPIYYIAGNN